MLRLDLCRLKLRWTGNWLKDLWIFTANTNPVLAIIYSHPFHPISRKERILITAMQMVFIMNLACVTAESAACVKCGINTCDDNSSCVVSMPKWWGSYLEEREELSGEQGYRNLCCMCSKLGVIFFLNTFRIFDISFGAPLYLFLANIIFAQVCYQLGAMCGCCPF